MSIAHFKRGSDYKYKLPPNASLQDIADGSGVHKTTVSRVMRGDAEGTDAFVKVKAFIESLGAKMAEEAVDEILVDRTIPRYSSGQRLFSAMLQATVEDRELTVLVGPSGAGKTHCVKEFAAENPETLVLQAQQRMSVGDLLTALCKLFECPAGGTNYQRLERILSNCGGKMLIVDEADLFVYDRSNGQVIRFLDIFRQLHDRGCAVALVGLPLLFDGIVKSGETYVYRRIGYFRKIGAPTLDELADFWRSLTPGIPEAHAKAGIVAQQALRFGLYGYLQKLADRTRKMDGDVEAAISFLFRPEL